MTGDDQAHMGVLFAVLSALSYSSSSVIVKKGMAQHQQGNGYFMTLVLNVVVIGLVLLFSLFFRGEILTWNWGAFWLFVFAGFLTTGLGRFAFYYGIERIGPARTTAIRNTAPLWTLVIALAVLNERIAPIAWLGMTLLMTGVGIQGYSLYLAQVGRDRAAQETRRWGYFIAVISSVSFGLGGIVRQLGLQVQNEPFLGALVGAITALIIFLGIEGMRGTLKQTLEENFHHFNKYYFLSGVISSFGPLFFFVALYYTHVAYVTMVAATEAIFTSLLSAIFLKKIEDLTLSVWISAFFAMGGSVLIALTK